MALLEQGVASKEASETDTSSQVSEPALLERIPGDQWSKLTKTQKRNIMRRRKEVMSGLKPQDRPEAETGEKRPRDQTNFTPSPDKEGRKRQKIEKPKYSHVINCHKVAIIHDRHPTEGLTEETMEKLQMSLLERMGRNRPDEGGVQRISFCGISKRQGALVISCVDERSKNWLVEETALMTPFEGITLKTCDPKLLEGFKRIGMFVPKPTREIPGILDNIRGQNSGLDTSRWKILPGGCKKGERGTYIVASVPESHYTIMEKNGSQISHGFHMVEVKLIGKDQAPSAEKEKKMVESEVDPRVEKMEEREGSSRAPSGAGEVSLESPAEVTAASQASATGLELQAKGQRQLVKRSGRVVTEGGGQGCPQGPGGRKTAEVNPDSRSKPGGDKPPS